MINKNITYIHTYVKSVRSENPSDNSKSRAETLQYVYFLDKTCKAKAENTTNVIND